MGGNALKNAYTERKNKADYESIMSKVRQGLHELFPGTNHAPVQAYHRKTDFGDADILICDDHLPKWWIAMVKDHFNPKQIFINRIGAKPISVDRDEEVPVIDNDIFAVSFDFEKFQIDLVVVQEEIFRIAQVYYSFNDLGNFMGRIADRMGYKYGWNGLTKSVRKPGDQTVTMGTITVSIDPYEIFPFLGYDIERFKLGFDTMEEVYQYAASSEYFHRSIYALEQRNNKDRVRDEKRISYTNFLKWMDAQDDSIDRFEWCTYPLGAWHDTRWKEIEMFEVRGIQIFSHLGSEVARVKSEYVNGREAKKVWNGLEVGNVTGLQGPELKELMNYCIRHYVSEPDARGFTFSAWVKDKSHAEVAEYVRRKQKLWEAASC